MEAQKSFENLKDLMAYIRILMLKNFENNFQVDCESSCMGIGVVLSEGGHPIAFFSVKLGVGRKN